MTGWEKGWESPTADLVSVEREKGFEPSTSTLARWRPFLRALENKREERRVRDLTGPPGTAVGHQGVGRWVGGISDLARRWLEGGIPRVTGSPPAPESDNDVLAPLRRVTS